MPKTIDGLELGSNEEHYFKWFCDDLKSKGVLKDFTYSGDSPGIEIFPAVYGVELDKKARKTFVLEKKKSIAQSLTYRADFRLEFDPKYRFIFCDLYGINTGAPFMELERNNSGVVHVEVKPAVQFKGKSVGSHDSLRRFRVIQKVLLNETGWFISLVEVPKIFKETFIPSRYYYCDNRRSQARKIKFKSTGLDNFIEERRKHIKAINEKGFKHETDVKRRFQEAISIQGW